jgi:hypothetical protein
MERANDSDAKFEVVTFDLATGAKVRAVIDEFWEQLSGDDLRRGQQARLYFAIRIYTDEETNPKRLVSHTEFRAGNDFDQSCIPKLWAWLVDLGVSRHRFSYECVEEFLEEFSARMDEFTASAEDAADYLHKAHGIRPTYEDPPHAEFPEDEFDPIRSRESERIVLEQDELPTDPDLGPMEVRIEHEAADEPGQL